MFWKLTLEEHLDTSTGSMPSLALDTDGRRQEIRTRRSCNQKHIEPALKDTCANATRTPAKIVAARGDINFVAAASPSGWSMPKATSVGCLHKEHWRNNSTAAVANRSCHHVSPSSGVSQYGLDSALVRANRVCARLVLVLPLEERVDLLLRQLKPLDLLEALRVVVHVVLETRLVVLSSVSTRVHRQL